MVKVKPGVLNKVEFPNKKYKIDIHYAYWMGIYEVTQAQYQAVTGKNPTPKHQRGNDKPVVVNGNFEYRQQQCYDFCNLLNRIYADKLPEGYKFDLPTESEWTYACRANTQTDLNNGKNITNKHGYCPNLDEIGWYKANSNGKLQDVGLKAPNKWGLYDMHGNIMEVVQKYHYSKGGYYSCNPENCRASGGISSWTDNGFRIILVRDVSRKR